MTAQFDPSKRPTSFYEFIALRRVDGHGPPATREVRYSTVYPPRSFGSPIAFGGSVLAPAAQAAFCALQEIAGDAASASAYSPYSFQGCFVGASSIKQALDIHVKTVRFTNSFATFLIETSQTDSKGKTRKSVVATFDFIRPSQAILDLKPIPKNPVTGLSWSAPEKLMSYYDEIDQRVASGKPSPHAAAVERLIMVEWTDILEVRIPPNSFTGETMGGLVPTLKTSQDHLHPTEKRAADWQRYRTPFTADAIAKDAFAQSGLDITPASANTAAMCHIADTRLAWMTPATAAISLQQLDFTATLDFSIRFHRSQKELHADQWFLREMRGVSAAEGRSFGEARFWDRQGNLTLTMSQQCLLRPRNADSKPLPFKL
ncbi:unnamed protein product [Tilletia laevis]|uniref:Acyl-CoA thioesterase II n=2 Tax=Tilletia TaxID=13289 RepID=A0A177UZ02_9BASI|nr:hypothetical protein CF336_g2811 [Tilletia laevis]KAE8264184.1 hypothetical protein A4X03_0g1127 [Tilletia caries]CAD6935230.1 unnamed protein product [Tilletia controversa]KAE8205135.1 hypothetical protein CF335_g2408 [Tilletia laevis]CAD6888512.1 unnamed protein product [Tilletia caries]